jgi:hypothetical protein
MVARSLQDRIAALTIPDEQVIEGIAEAIYETHRRDPAPIFQNASAFAQDWSRAQARAALDYVRAQTRRIR